MSSARSVLDGIMLRRFATGERKGQIKVPKPVEGLIERGLVAVEDKGEHWPAAKFTQAGLRGLLRRRDAARSGHLWVP